VAAITGQLLLELAANLPWWGKDQALALDLGAALVPPMALLILVGGAFRAFASHALATLASQTVRPLLGLILVAALGVAGAVDAASLLFWSASIPAAGLVLLFAIRLPGEIRRARASYRFREWLKLGFVIGFSNLAILLFNRVDVLMVGSLAGSVDTAVYGAASNIARLGLVFLGAISMVVGPMLADGYAAGDRSRVVSLLKLAALTSGTLGLLVFLLIAWKGEYLLLLFGSEYVHAKTLLLVLLAGQVVQAATGPVGMALTFAERARLVAAVSLVALVGNIALNALLIPAYGAMGAAIATALMIAIRPLVLFGVLWGGKSLPQGPKGVPAEAG
jgi:O-antigen/teichoic acid export membrane protein